MTLQEDLGLRVSHKVHQDNAYFRGVVERKQSQV